MAFNRWKERVNGYVLLFYDDYPPFEFESSDGAPDTAE